MMCRVIVMGTGEEEGGRWEREDLELRATWNAASYAGWNSKQETANIFNARSLQELSPNSHANSINSSDRKLT